MVSKPVPFDHFSTCLPASKLLWLIDLHKIFRLVVNDVQNLCTSRFSFLYRFAVFAPTLTTSTTTLTTDSNDCSRVDVLLSDPDLLRRFLKIINYSQREKVKNYVRLPARLPACPHACLPIRLSNWNSYIRQGSRRVGPRQSLRSTFFWGCYMIFKFSSNGGQHAFIL